MSNPYQNVYNYTPSSVAPSSAFVFTAGRWAGAESVVRNAAWLFNCRVEIEVDHGWIEHVYRVRISGQGCNDAISRIQDVIRKRGEVSTRGGKP